MHLVVIAWLYMIGLMALSASSAGLGIVLFVSVGMLPVLGWMAWRGRKLRAARRARELSSSLEQGVRGSNDPDAQADQ